MHYRNLIGPLSEIVDIGPIWAPIYFFIINDIGQISYGLSEFERSIFTFYILEITIGSNIRTS